MNNNELLIIFSELDLIEQEFKNRIMDAKIKLKARFDNGKFKNN